MNGLVHGGSKPTRAAPPVQLTHHFSAKALAIIGTLVVGRDGCWSAHDMTANQFRKIALEFPGVIESAHMNHLDFRVAGKIFATLGYPDDEWGMVKLTSEQQRTFVEKAAV